MTGLVHMSILFWAQIPGRKLTEVTYLSRNTDRFLAHFGRQIEFRSDLRYFSLGIRFPAMTRFLTLLFEMHQNNAIIWPKQKWKIESICVDTCYTNNNYIHLRLLCCFLPCDCFVSNRQSFEFLFISFNSKLRSARIQYLIQSNELFMRQYTVSRTKWIPPPSKYMNLLFI